MKETGYVYRIPPCPAYDVASNQHWLEAMASKGFILEKDGFFGGIATFRKEQPQRLRYRLEATPTRDGIFSDEATPDPEARALNSLMGWKYVGRRGQFHIYVCADESAPELHTDPRVQAITFKTLNKYLTREICNSIIYFLIMYLIHYSRMMISMFLLLGTPAMTLLWLLVILVFVKKIHGLVHLLRLQRKLKNGEQPHIKGNFKKKACVHKCSLFARIIAWILCVVLACSNAAARFEAIPLPLENSKFPFLTLAELYPESTVRQEDLFINNEYRYWSDWICPEIYDYSERADITHPDGSTISCSLNVEYFDTRWEWVAQILAQELPAQQGANPLEQLLDGLFNQQPTILTPLDVPGLDSCVTYEEYRGVPYMVLRSSTTVMRIRLSVLGEGDPITSAELACLLADHLKK